MWGRYKKKGRLPKFGLSTGKACLAENRNYFNNVIFFVAVNPSPCRW
jgi:hypothetical protein